MTPATRNLFALADKLGLMVCEMKQRMPFKEYLQWLEYHKYVSEQFEHKEAVMADSTDEDVLRAFNVKKH